MADVAELFFLPLDEIFVPDSAISDGEAHDQVHSYHNETLELISHHSGSATAASDPFAGTLDTCDFGFLDDVRDMAPDYFESNVRVALAHTLYPGLNYGFIPEPVDSDSVSQIDPTTSSGVSNPGDLVSSLYWDCIRADPEEDFEWEEVVIDGLGFVAASESIHVDDAIDGEMGWSREWGVLLLDGSEGEEDAEAFNTSEEYEILIEQMAQHDDSSIRAIPPAAKSVVLSLPSVVLAEEGVERNSTHCAVCKDEISLEERVTRLPCSHYYHKECILPWLGIRNTCPVCRYELPTDDPEYERVGGV
ncbi:uncharacterized protein [Typha latifolia]|uniref:uncharacterized protein n=1 Tax=Typha latifolia TaxID=4733 RepID=UPI003C2B0E57